MGITSAITALFAAATAALRAFPLWLSWRQSERIENLTDELLDLESRSLPAERPRLERVRVKLALARKQHAALLAVIASSEGGPAGADHSRDLRPPGG